MDSGNLLGSRVLLPDESEIYAVGLLPPSIDPVPAQLHLRRHGHPRPGLGRHDARCVGNERNNIFYKVPLSSDEYLLLENRYLSPGDTLLKLDADSVTKVVLGPQAARTASSTTRSSRAAASWCGTWTRASCRSIARCA